VERSVGGHPNVQSSPVTGRRVHNRIGIELKKESPPIGCAVPLNTAWVTKQTMVGTFGFQCVKKVRNSVFIKIIGSS
jgi:hypothetical protein